MERECLHGQESKKNLPLAGWLILAAMVGVVTFTKAQTPEIDSIQVKNAAGIKKVDALNELSFRLLLVDFAKANETLAQSKALAEQLNYKKGISEATIFQGIYENLTGNKKQALRLLSLGVEQAKLADNSGW
ncbi:MAG: hypothetical protein LW721_12105 [Flammeovirgaceae bacterium]|jgi:hypothetical protein|nr:hypothetical protein [Flammeovirgaceae bacterium]